jgi:peptidoglycan hydrolase-like protein with peptidoglycan-binding domain
MPSINGFTVVQYGAPELATFTVPGSDTRLSVRREVAPLLIGLARDFHATVEPLNPRSCWGHAPRKIRGSNAWSYHAPGIAIDLNADAHPMGSRGTFSAARQQAIRALLARYTYNGVRLLRWGGDYHNRADEMHFELIVPRGIALAAVGMVQSPGAVPAGAVPAVASSAHRPGSRDLQLADPHLNGDDVGYVQRWIGERRCGRADGNFGPQTRDGVVWYQQMRGITPNGICDRQTWGQMRVAVSY